MSYSFIYTAAALLGLVTPMDQALIAMMSSPSFERGETGAGASPFPPPAPFIPRDGRWRIGGTEGEQKLSSLPRANTTARHTLSLTRRPSGYALHLASYLGETWAHRGWQELKRQSPALNGRNADFRSAQVPALGPVVRLTIGRYESLADAAGACADLRRQVDYCAPLPLFEE